MHKLLDRITGGGLSVEYRFTRMPHISSLKMLAVEVVFKNTLESNLSGVGIGATRLQSGMTMRNTAGPQQITPGNSASITIGIDFNDTLQPAKFEVW